MRSLKDTANMKSSRLTQATMVIIDGNVKREVTLSPGERLLIGRTVSSLRMTRQGADVENLGGRTYVHCSPAADVSEQHVEVRMQPDGTVLLKDLRSTNGTMMRVPAHQDVVLPPDSEVLLGRSLMIRLRTRLWETDEDPGGYSSATDFTNYIEARLAEYKIQATLLEGKESQPSRSGTWRMKLPLPAYGTYLEVTGSKTTANLEIERWLRLQVLLFNSGSLCIPIGKYDRLAWQFTAASSGRQRALQAARRVAATDGTILLRGKTGVGKDVLAHDIHNHSARTNNAFLAVNCAAITTTLAESNLFGSVKGAYTDAVDKAGMFEQAHGGTLFLDEIGELSLDLQAKLLRVLEDKIVHRVGDVIARPINVRIIAATHRNLPAMVASGQFREDLWYRLEGVQIHIPKLEKEDIRVIVPIFYQEALQAEKCTPLCEDEVETLAVLSANERWDGNARQLRNAIRRYLLHREPTLTVEENWHNAMSLAGGEPELNPLPSTVSAKENQSAESDLPDDLFLAIGLIEKLITLCCARTTLFGGKRWGANGLLGKRLGLTGTGALDRVRRLLGINDKQPAAPVEAAAIDRRIQETRNELQRFAGPLRQLLQI